MRSMIRWTTAVAVASVLVAWAQAQTTVRVSVGSDGTQGDGASAYPAISANGAWVAFFSEATILVAGDSNSAFDVFVRDRGAGMTERVSDATRGSEADSVCLYP